MDENQHQEIENQNIVSKSEVVSRSHVSLWSFVFISAAVSVFSVLLTLYAVGFFTNETEVTTVKEESISTHNHIPDMVASVSEAVVSVVVTRDVPVYERYYEYFNPFGMGQGFAVPSWRESGETRAEEVGGGSGFFISEDGLLITNTHVVSDRAARYSVLLNDGSAHDVEVLWRSTDLDIAVLQLTDVGTVARVKVLSWADSDKVRPGETVVAIGNALAEFRNSVSVGVISGLARTIVARDGQGNRQTLESVIQTDAAINPGNSGGPLLNTRGEVVGVNVATTEGVDNISFAIPANVVKEVLENLQAEASES